nr:hypothetical protein [Stenotrophomonas pavanii]
MAEPLIYCPAILNWPCIPSSEWAAWAQVFVAVAIGFAAVYVPWRIVQGQTNRRISSALTLCGITAFQFLQASDAAVSRDPEPMNYKYFRGAGQDMLQALRQIPTHELIKWEVMHARIYLELRCVELTRHGDTWHNDQNGFACIPHDAHEEMKRLRDLVSISVKEISGLMRKEKPLIRRLIDDWRASR